VRRPGERWPSWLRTSPHCTVFVTCECKTQDAPRKVLNIAPSAEPYPEAPDAGTRRAPPASAPDPRPTTPPEDPVPLAVADAAVFSMRARVDSRDATAAPVTSRMSSSSFTCAWAAVKASCGTRLTRLDQLRLQLLACSVPGPVEVRLSTNRLALLWATRGVHGLIVKRSRGV
jgi:hypothetical protein